MDMKILFEKVYANEISKEKALALLKTQNNSELYGKDNSCFPLSEGQKGLWVINQLASNSYAYNLPGAFWIKENTNLEILKKTLSLLVKRHPSLRTIIVNNDDQIQQKVIDDVEIHFLAEDLSSFNDNEINSRIKAISQEPFDITKYPLMRTNLFITEKGKILLINFHHMIFDGISSSIFIYELDYIYNSLVNGNSTDIDRKKGSYQDFVSWQKNLLKSDRGEKLKKYWLDKLADEIKPLNLPYDKSHPQIPTYNGDLIEFTFNERLFNCITDISASLDVTRYQFMLSVLYILLFKYTNQSDILVSSPVAGRSKKDFESVIGYFMNMIVLREKIDAESSFHDLLLNVNESVLSALENSDFPYYTLANELGRNHRRMTSQIFNIAFYYQNWIGDNLKNPDSIIIDAYNGIQQVGEFDLTFEIYETKTDFILHLKYNTDVFESSTVKTMGNCFLNLFEQIIIDMNKKIRDYSLLSEAELNRQLIEWNNTGVEYAKEVTFIDLFKQKVKENGENIAVVCQGSHLTYNELNIKTDKLVNYLLSLGIKKGDFLGVFHDRSIDMLIGLISIMKIGAVYVPLDTDYPYNRIKYMIDDANLSYILTQSSHADKLDNLNVKFINLDSDWNEIERFNSENGKNADMLSHIKVTGDDIVYILYTSGSTGNPKGVEVLHKGLANLLLSMSCRPGFTCSDYMLAITTISFDISGLELYLPLINGGVVEIVPSHIIKDGIKLKEFIENSDATFVQATPATWRMLIAAEWNKKSRFKILCGGESLNNELAEKLLEYSDEVWNVYGPTETTIWSSIEKIEKNQIVTIGRPINNTQFYILDEYLSPLPVGVPGELYIGGDGLARGYHNNDTETKNRFIPDPFASGKNKFIYKTGDLVRYRQDGKVEYVGRIDQQVKLRGFRIELEEIVQVLNKKEGIKDNVVLLREDKSGYKYLAAYIIMEETHIKITEAQLKKHLLGWIPEYMVPSKYVFLKVFPLTLNKKIDKKILMQMDIDEIKKQYGIVDDKIDVYRNNDGNMPSLMQIDLRNIIGEIAHYKADNIDFNTHIGEYGFDSIRFTELSAYLNRKYKININPTLFYQYSTIRQISEYFNGNFPQAFSQYQTDDIHHINNVSKTIQDSFQKNNFMNNEDIAIVGIGAKFPQSENIDEFWEHLINEEDLITKIPADRWNDDLLKNCDYDFYGGFINDVDKFDAAFFGISPREAEQMDPQQRLFLEIVWHTIESAGMKPSDLSGSKTGVFVGVSSVDYGDLMGNYNQTMDTYSLTGLARTIIANRVSFHYNFYGPSETIDSACSSSMVALNRAILSIKNGECEAAFAGGINLMLSPFVFLALSKNGMISKEGHCKTFDAAADGYVRGEGIGVVLLKPLAKALSDGNPIYAVIKGSAENHGGRANSLTAPSTNAQSELIKSVYINNKIDPSTITYIEAHGTGTALGDPIEVNSLILAFSEIYKSRNMKFQNKKCGIGSVKTNIGHLEAAAGIAGVIKVILSMKNKTMPATINFKTLNPYITLDDSPFYIVEKTKIWQNLKDEKGDLIPLRAGVSSFGMGGANVHVLLEEYLNKSNTANDKNKRCLFPISAKNHDRLHDYAVKLSDYFNKHKDLKDVFLSNISYTMQAGREDFNSRIAIIASSLDELSVKLKQYADGVLNIEGVYVGNEKSDRANGNTLDKEYIKNLFINDQLEEISELWISGAKIDWQEFYQEKILSRIPLPGYPFARERFWIETDPIKPQSNAMSLTPLIDSNESTMEEQCYKKVLKTNDFYIKDHVVNKQFILPGVVYLEMVRMAGNLAYKKRIVSDIKNVVWSKPVILSRDDMEIFIGFSITGKNFNFNVYSLENDSKIIHCTGKIIYSKSSDMPGSNNETIDISSIKKRCKENLSKDECYKLFELGGFEYGQTFKGIEEINYNGNEALSVIQLPDEHLKNFADYNLHPSLMEASLQTAIVLLTMAADNRKAHLPFTIDQIEIKNLLPLKGYVYVTYATDGNNAKNRFNIIITDESGKISIRIRNYLVMPVIANSQEKPDVFYFKPVWENNNVKKIEKENFPLKTILFVNIGNENIKYMQENTRDIDFSKYRLVYLEDNKIKIFGSYGKSVEKFDTGLFEEKDYELLMEYLSKNDLFPESIIFFAGKCDDEIKSAELGDDLDKHLFPIVYLLKAHIKISNKRKTNIYYIYDRKIEFANPLHSAITGLGKSINNEYPWIYFKSIGFFSTGKLIDNESVLNKVLIAFKEMDIKYINREIWYRDDERYEKIYRRFSSTYKNNNESVIKENGVYVITGGAGKLGMLFANIISQICIVKIIIAGRSDTNVVQKREMEAIEKKGSKVLFVKCDVTKKEDTINLINICKKNFGQINGIIHCAGTIDDDLFIYKTKNDILKVIEPKINGLINIDESLNNDYLDFLLLFSSISAVIGNTGQSDYSYANSFMDEFAAMRNDLKAKGIRQGTTYSVDWSLWQNGGMAVSKETLDFLSNTVGIKPLNESAGLTVLNDLNSVNQNQFVVIEKNKNKSINFYEIQESVSSPETANKKIKKEVNSEINNDLLNMIRNYLLRISQKILKIAENKINPDEDMSDYGFNSLSFIELGNKINESFKTEITPAVFFEYVSLSGLARYFYDEHHEEIIKYFNAEDFNFQGNNGINKLDDFDNNEGESIRFSDLSEKVSNNIGNEPIAIIGMNGIMPQSDNLDEFWRHLENGDDLISIVPSDRWNWKEFYGNPQKEGNRTYSKWGGFMRNIDKFDAPFFNLFPRDAKAMDPQQRMFLQVLWKTVEDAGYRMSDLSGDKIGLFVGVSNADYSDIFKANMDNIDVQSLIGNSQPYLPNRISYLLNWQGPSEFVDTLCSSSLVAIHRAVLSIRNNDCKMAIAGGVNMMLLPTLNIFFSKAGMLSSNGRCKTFDKNADGFVRGEGIGAILLKPLSKAIKDKDNIYATIVGSSINHGGHASTLTSPNPTAQAEVIKNAYISNNIDPSTISYIETHGTGTSLGDPVEVNGLKMAFKNILGNKYFSEEPYCGLGSVKTNIGHLESAAGIASIIKVLLSMKNKKIPASLHFKEMNPYIDLKNSPFYINYKTRDWKNRAGLDDLPRRAGVSSFGAGGVNAHIILEEYQDKNVNTMIPSSTIPELVMLSAKTKEQLNQYAINIIEFIEKNSGKERIDVKYNAQKMLEEIQLKIIIQVSCLLGVDKKVVELNEPLELLGLTLHVLEELFTYIKTAFLIEINQNQFYAFSTIKELSEFILNNVPAGFKDVYKIENTIKDDIDPQVTFTNIAYTLHTGREAMDFRLGIIALDLNDLLKKLKEFINNENDNNYIFYGNVIEIKNISKNIIDGEEGIDYLNSLIRKRNLFKLAQLWINGINFPADNLYNKSYYKRIPLPTYPFANIRYWISDDDNSKQKAKGSFLIDRKQSTDDENFIASKIIESSESILKDHVVFGTPILPGVCYIEMAYEALSMYRPSKTFKLAGISWLKPLVFNESDEIKEIFILFHENANHIEFIIYCNDDKTIPYAKGKFELYSPTEITNNIFLNVKEINERCGILLEKEILYRTVNDLGIHYGKYYRSISEIHSNNIEALGYFQLPDELENEFEQCILHPSIMDGALQVVAGVNLNSDKIYLPFSIDEIVILNPLPKKGIYYVQKKDEKSYNVAILDESGLICVKLLDINLREGRLEQKKSFYYLPVWNKVTPEINDNGNKNLNVLIVYNTFSGTLVNIIKKTNAHNFIQEVMIDISNFDESLQNLSDILGKKNIDKIYFTGVMESNIMDVFDLNKWQNIIKAGIFCLFKLSKLMIKHDYHKKRIHFTIITDNVHSLFEEENIRPFFGGLNGFCKSLKIEFPFWNINYIDIDWNEIDRDVNGDSYNSFIKYLGTKNTDNNYNMLVLRRGCWYTEQIKNVNIDTVQPMERNKLKKNGVYVILGGNGGIGFELCKYLYSKYSAKIMLIGRKPFDDNIKSKIYSITSDERKIKYFQADISDYESINRVFDAIYAEYGIINGIFHSTLVLKDNLLQNMNDMDFDSVLLPKVQGSIVLNKVLKDKKMDFIAFFSSIQSFIAYPGQSNYVSACSFKDTFANFMGNNEKLPVYIINWGYWGEVGVVSTDVHQKRLESQGMGQIKIEEGMEAIETIINGSIRQVFFFKADKKLLDFLDVETGTEIDREKDKDAGIVINEKLSSQSMIVERFEGQKEDDRQILEKLIQLENGEVDENEIVKYIFKET